MFYCRMRITDDICKTIYTEKLRHFTVNINNLVTDIMVSYLNSTLNCFRPGGYHVAKAHKWFKQILGKIPVPPLPT